MGKSKPSRLVTVVVAGSILFGACGTSEPTSADRPEDGSLDPSVEPSPTAIPTPTPLPTTTDYVVVAGDTLFGIATSFNVGVDELLEANGISVDAVLNVGDTMRVPIPPPVTETDAEDTGEGTVVLTEYTVTSGDTLGSIASRFDTTAEELAKINEIAADTVLNIGDSLQVPVPSASSAESAPEGPVQAPGGSTINVDEYVVVSGDTPGAVAARFGVTLGELLEANSLGADSVLQIGQVLTIPEI